MTSDLNPINPTQEATTVPESDEILPIINQVQPPLITPVDTVAAQVDILVARSNPVSKSVLEYGLVKATATVIQIRFRKMI